MEPIDLFSAVPRRGRSRGSLRSIAATLVLVAVPASLVAQAPTPRRWTDAELVASYQELAAGGLLDQAIRTPSLPGDAAQKSFLDALAWFAAGTPEDSGALSLRKLDGFVDGQVELYRQLIADKVERNASNDYPRTKTWKVIQKLAVLRADMVAAGGVYRYPQLPKATEANDSWERAHTIASAEAFTKRVCQDSHERPVLIKFGNTNCTQCHLFELIGSIKDLAEGPGLEGAVDVYKVWWGLRPDESFAAMVRQPTRLDEIAKAEGVQSSPYFIVYRNGRRHSCGDSFPGGDGSDPRLASCTAQATGDGPLASVCGASS
jgi:hypothetical protein